jgi:hypothetical protein
MDRATLIGIAPCSGALAWRDERVALRMAAGAFGSSSSSLRDGRSSPECGGSR